MTTEPKLSEAQKTIVQKIRDGAQLRRRSNHALLKHGGSEFVMLDGGYSRSVNAAAVRKLMALGILIQQPQRSMIADSPLTLKDS